MIIEVECSAVTHCSFQVIISPVFVLALSGPSPRAEAFNGGLCIRQPAIMLEQDHDAAGDPPAGCAGAGAGNNAPAGNANNEADFRPF